MLFRGDTSGVGTAGTIGGSVRPASAVPEQRRGPVFRTLRRLTAHGVYLASNLLGDDVVGRRARVLVLRAAGADLGHGAMLHGGTYITYPSRLVVGAGTFVSRSCYFDLEADLVLGAHVTIGHGTSFVTTRHRLGPAEQRCGGFTGDPISVGDGAWLGANVTVLPGVRIGRGAVVAAGAVVASDVPDNALVAGVPAKVRRSLGADAE